MASKKTPTPKRSVKRAPRRPKGRKEPGIQLKVVLAALFLCGFLVLSLVFLAHLRESLRPAPAPPLAPPPPLVSDRQVLLEDIRVELESALLRSGLSLDSLKFTGADPQYIRIKGAMPPAGIIENLAQRLQRLSTDIRLQVSPAETQVVLYWENRLRFQLDFQPPEIPPPPAPGPRVAIIMDDLGRSMQTAQALLDIPLPVVFAILPGEPFAAPMARLAHKNGREVIIHIPMEPQRYPAINPGSDALLTRYTDGELRRRFRTFLKQVPHAIGGNNHMGSHFTENRGKMATVLDEMKQTGLFFVDSLTSGRSVAFREARKAGLPAAVRDVFLDNDQDVAKIARQIRKLAKVARHQGSAVGICHPYPQTLAALRQEARYLKEQGIEVVPISSLLVH